MKASYQPPKLIVNKVRGVSYEVLQFISHGQFGKVFQVLNIQTGEICAMKLVCVNYIKPTNRFVLKREINFSIMNIDEQLAECPFIIQYKDVFQFEHDKLSVLCFVMELCKYSLEDYMYEISTSLEVKLVADQLIRAIDWLHSKNIVHRDIKPANIMFDSNNQLKLLDFGFSKKIGTTTNTEIGTLKYMDPRIKQGHAYGKECDIYSLGIVILEMLEKVKDKDDVYQTLETISKQFCVNNIDERAGLEDYMDLHFIQFVNLQNE